MLLRLRGDSKHQCFQNIIVAIKFVSQIVLRNLKAIYVFICTEKKQTVIRDNYSSDSIHFCCFSFSLKK